MKPEDIEVTPSSGNVYEDLGFEDADEMALKSDIAYIISTIIQSRGLTQAEAAEILGVNQPKISALVRGRLSGFSLDRLFRFLTALDRDVEVSITPKIADFPRGRLKVREVA